MKRLIITLIGIVLFLSLTRSAILFLVKNKPIAEKKETREMPPVVEVVPVSRGDIALSLMSEGLVFARRETVLSAQVAGRITHVHPNFEVGGSFVAGDLVAQLDQVDYETALAQAQASLADARLTLAQEKARGAQAKRDWQKIGGGKTPSDLVLRLPYLASAKARVTATQALVDKAVEDLGRTRIMAPFDCRVRETNFDLGAMVGTGARLGLVYDPEKYLVRLPFALDDYAELPDDAEVLLMTEIAGKNYSWRGEVLWNEGDIDRETLSAYVVAEILPNEEVSERFRLPPPGLFVQAKLTGAKLTNVISVPRLAVRGRDQIFIMNQEGKLEFRTLKIVRSSSELIYASAGVEDGEFIVTTKLELPVAGMKLTVTDGEDH